jgi:predicted enzyme related to lactoylglutathione lyase
MAEFTIPKHGQICWRELHTKNSDAAKNFYAGLLDWKFEQSKAAQTEYTEIHVSDKAVGGVMQITEKWGENWEKIPSSWVNYIAVDDCAATIEKIKLNGGAVFIEPFEASGVGIISFVKDPGGIIFGIIQFVSK